MHAASRTYLIYVDDSGNEDVGWLWSGLAIPFDLWTEYLGRWLAFRRWLFSKHGIPANFEFHSQAWIGANPAKQATEEDLALIGASPGAFIDILRRGRDARRERVRVFEKSLKTIGTFTEARLFTAYVDQSTGPAKIEL